MLNLFFVRLYLKIMIVRLFLFSVHYNYGMFRILSDFRTSGTPLMTTINIPYHSSCFFFVFFLKCFFQQYHKDINANFQTKVANNKIVSLNFWQFRKPCTECKFSKPCTECKRNTNANVHYAQNMM